MESASPPSAAPLPEGRWGWLGPALALLLLAELALVWSHPRLPTNDGPAHQYSAWVAHRLRVDPGGPLARWFELNPRAIYPNAGYSWFLEALADRVPMPVAEKLGASIFLLALPLATALLARAAGRRPELAAFLAAALAPGFPFFMGFFNFLWGVPLALLFWANLLVLLRERSLPRLLLSNAVLAAAFCAHLVAFAVAAGGGLVLIASEFRRPTARRALLGVAPVLAAAPFFWPRTVGLGASLEWSEGPLERLVATVTMGVASAWGGSERVGAAVAGLALFALLAAGLRHAGERGGALRLLVAALLVLALASPSAVGSGSFLGERVMLFFWLAAAAASQPPAGRLRTLAAAAVLVAALAHLVFLEGACRRFDREVEPYLAMASAIPADAQLFAYNYTGPHRSFVAAPMATVDACLHLALGSPDFRLYQAVPPDAPYFPIRYTEEGRARYPRRALHDRLPLFRVAPWADAILLWRAQPSEIRRVLRTGRYRLALERGRLRLFLSRPAAASPASTASVARP